jgi:hypothetical protein
MEKRFRALRVIATIYKIVAWIVLICGVLFALIFFATAMLAASGRDLPGLLIGSLGGVVVVAIGALLYAAVLFLVLYGAGEAVFLALAIEENTRESALLMRNLPRVT